MTKLNFYFDYYYCALFQNLYTKLYNISYELVRHTYCIMFSDSKENKFNDERQCNLLRDLRL